MTATEVLRRMLDERGVEWVKWGASDTYRLLVTSWKDASGHSWAFMEHRDGSFSKLTAYHLTPEQAIAATLGSCSCSNGCTNGEQTGTCHPIISDNLAESEGTGDAWADCSECGHLLFVLTDPNSQVPNFCPNCGRRVEQ